MGCILCILGASILALNAPETQSVTTVPQLQKLWVSPGKSASAISPMTGNLTSPCHIGFLTWGMCEEFQEAPSRNA